MSDAYAYMGYNSGCIGTVTVDGAGSSWTNSSSLTIGDSGSETLTIQNGGSVSAASVSIADVAGSRGTLNIGAASGQTAVAPGTLNTATVAFGAGTGLIVFNHTASDYVFAPTITGAGSVRVEAGTTILTAANTYIGATTMNGGTLEIGDASHPGASIISDVTVNSGGTLAGRGTIFGDVDNGYQPGVYTATTYNIISAGSVPAASRR